MQLIKFVVALLAMTSATIHAQETGTLQKIKDSKTIVLGVRESSIPFSYLDDNHKYVGYTVDLCLKIVGAIKKQLDMSDIEVKYVPVVSSNRTAMMTGGVIDLECGSTTNNQERQQQVAFAPTSFLTATRVLAKKSSHITGFADLRGKNLVVTSGTANLREVAALNTERNLGINITRVKDHAEGFAMVENDQAAGFAMDDILLASFAANAKRPGDYFITQESLPPEPYGIMLRRNDAAFKKLVDTTLTAVYTSSEINRIYARWFQSPIAPKGINLNWPMSEQLKRAFAKPTDSGNPADYK